MSDKPENPQAFPVPPSIWSDGDCSVATEGMTLRDWIAGELYPVLVHNAVIAESEPPSAREIAATAFDFAEAFLVERQRREHRR